MATIVTRSGKGSPLTNTEVDSNFTNLNNDKQEVLAEGSFADGDKTKLDGIESGANADQTAQEIATAIDADATAEATLKSALGLGTAAYTASTNYATAAQGALADSALQSIPDNYVLNTGDAITGNLSFGDNDKAIFGAGGDLQIYHDGSNSYVVDAGTGGMKIVGNTSTTFYSGVGGEEQAQFVANGACKLAHNASYKLATTSTGIDVTGTVTADGLQVQSTSTNLVSRLQPQTNSYTSTLLLSNASAGDGGIQYYSGDNSFRMFSYGEMSFYASTSNISGSYPNGLRLRIAQNGDISFYEDTGTTPKFFWDASLERLGLGTTSLTRTLHVNSGTTDIAARFESSDASVGIEFADSNTVNEPEIKVTTDDLAIRTGGSERMRIDSSGRVGIGTSSPETTLHLQSSTASLCVSDSTYPNDRFLAIDVGITGSEDVQYITVDQADSLAFGEKTNNHDRTIVNEHMRIDSSGRVGIGTSSPQGDLDVVGEEYIRAGSDGVAGAGGVLWLTHGTQSSVRSAKIEAQTTGSNDNALAFYTNAAYAAPVERMRIDSSGNLLVGTTSTGSASTGLKFESSDLLRVVRDGGTPFAPNRKTSDGTIIDLQKDGTSVGTISVTSSATSYNTSSDYRLKTDVQPMIGATERLKALKPVNFEWISSGERVDGFIAHEAQEVVPEAVTGTKDAVDAEGNPEYQGIDQSKLVPLLVATVQEQQAVIESLTARIEALEN